MLKIKPTQRRLPSDPALLSNTLYDRPPERDASDASTAEQGRRTAEQRADNEDVTSLTQDRSSSEHRRQHDSAQSTSGESNQTEPPAVDNPSANPPQKEKSTKLDVLQNVMNTATSSATKNTDAIERAPKGKPLEPIPILKSNVSV